MSEQRVAIVTGAARGIGAAVAQRLAQDGNAVAVLDLDEGACAGTVKAITEAGGQAIAVGCDVSKSDQVTAAVDRVVAELGAPTILVNNAGVLRDNLLFKMSEDDWDTVMSVHLRGSFLMSKACQAHMVEAGYGRMVFLSSTSALGNRGQANYASAKAGLQGLAKTLAIELGKFGVTANAIAPGFIETDMTAATAARGIGAAVAQRLATDGNAVAVLDLDEGACAGTVKAITEAGGKAIAIGCDVSKSDQVATAIERVVAELGAPTLLVNNAGVLRDNLLFKMSDDDWDTVMSVHLRGSFLMSRACQAHMVDAGYGRMVFLSSTSALGNRGQANYASAKAGLQGLAKTLAIELGKFGITANAIAPGFIETDMTAATAARVGVDFEEFKKATAATIPVNRTGKPEDIAAAASFFCSEEAGFVSGQVLYVAGGPRN